MRKRIAIVLNPKGGSSSASRVDALCAALRRRGATVDIHATSPEPGSAKNLACRASEAGAEAVVGFGGDGTICQVAEGLLGTTTPFAAFPGGTGNLFSRSYQPRLRPEHFAEMVVSGLPQAVDIIKLEYVDVFGQSHTHRILNGFSLGCLSDAICNAPQNLKRWFGQLAYAVGMACVAARPKPVALSLTCQDGAIVRRRAVHSSCLVVANTLPPLLSYLSRGCNASDGLADIINIDGRTCFDFIPTVGWLALLNPSRSRFYSRLRTSNLVVESEQPMLPNIDGDAGVPTRKLSFEVEPGAIRALTV